jgi:hypothetical protein
MLHNLRLRNHSILLLIRRCCAIFSEERNDSAKAEFLNSPEILPIYW